MSGGTRDWWKAIEAELDRLGDATDDPWVDAFDADPELTPDQLGFLAGLEDQPGVARLTEADDSTTGNPPGDAGSVTA